VKLCPCLPARLFQLCGCLSQKTAASSQPLVAAVHFFCWLVRNKVRTLFVSQRLNAMTDRRPAIFFRSRQPADALLRNQYTEAWSNIGRSLPRPKAVLCVSAHWYLPGTSVTAMDRPRTIHDFGGFPRELYEVQYLAPGSPELARRVRDLLAPFRCNLMRLVGAWITEPGPCYATCFQTPTLRLCS